MHQDIVLLLYESFKTIRSFRYFQDYISNTHVLKIETCLLAPKQWCSWLIIRSFSHLQIWNSRYLPFFVRSKLTIKLKEKACIRGTVSVRTLFLLTPNYALESHKWWWLQRLRVSQNPRTLLLFLLLFLLYPLQIFLSTSSLQRLACSHLSTTISPCP